MARGSQQILKQRGRVRLVETGNPATGVGYTVWDGSLGLWSGENLIEAELQFAQAVANSPS